MELRISEIMEKERVSIETLKNKIEQNGEKLSRTSISNIINGKTVPKVDTLNNIANALGVNIGELFAPPPGNNVLGIVLYNNQEYTVRNLEDLETLVAEIKQNQN